MYKNIGLGSVRLRLQIPKEVTGTCGSQQVFKTKIMEREQELYVESEFFEHSLGKKESRLMYLKDGRFKIVDYPNLLDFDFKDGKVISVTISKDGLEVEVPMMDRP